MAKEADYNCIDPEKKIALEKILEMIKNIFSEQSKLFPYELINNDSPTCEEISNYLNKILDLEGTNEVVYADSILEKKYPKIIEETRSVISSIQKANTVKELIESLENLNTGKSINFLSRFAFFVSSEKITSNKLIETIKEIITELQPVNAENLLKI